MNSITDQKPSFLAYHAGKILNDIKNNGPYFPSEKIEKPILLALQQTADQKLKSSDYLTSLKNTALEPNYSAYGTGASGFDNCLKYHDNAEIKKLEEYYRQAEIEGISARAAPMGFELLYSSAFAAAMTEIHQSLRHEVAELLTELHQDPWSPPANAHIKPGIHFNPIICHTRLFTDIYLLSTPRTSKTMSYALLYIDQLTLADSS